MDWLQLANWPEWLIVLYIGWNFLRAVGNWLKVPVGDHLPEWVSSLLRQKEEQADAAAGLNSRKQSLDYLRSKQEQERENELLTRLAGYLIDDQTDDLKQINARLEKLLQQTAIENKLLESLNIILKHLLLYLKETR
jgi:hypothetical protein